MINSSEHYYWNNFVINNEFDNPKSSFKNLANRLNFFQGLINYNTFRFNSILDFGCGVGDDLIGFNSFQKCKSIGLDISLNNIEICKKRQIFHGFNHIEFKEIDTYNLDFIVDKSIDLIICHNVFQYLITHPIENYLKEFNRILSDNGKVLVVVYNKDSIAYHLYSSYIKKILENKFRYLSSEDAFKNIVFDCNYPKINIYSQNDFTSLSEQNNFKAEFKGGYLTEFDSSELYMTYIANAFRSNDLEDEHKEFLQQIYTNYLDLCQLRTKNTQTNSKLAGLNGTYILTKKEI